MVLGRVMLETALAWYGLTGCLRTIHTGTSPLNRIAPVRPSYGFQWMKYHRLDTVASGMLRRGGRDGS